MSAPMSLAEAALIMENGTDQYSTVEEQNAAKNLLDNISDVKALRAEVAQLRQAVATSEQFRWEDQTRYLDEWHSYRRELALLRQERDDWKLAFETSNEAVGKLESRLATLTAALEGLEHLWRVHAGVLRDSWEADENEAVALAFEMCAARISALLTPETRP